MVFVSLLRAERFKRSLLFLLVLVFLSANMVTNRHVVHPGLSKIITLDRQVRRELSRAERENLKTSVLSAREEIVFEPLLETSRISWFQDIVLNSYSVLDSPTQLQPKTIFLDSSPILNL